MKINFNIFKSELYFKIKKMLVNISELYRPRADRKQSIG